MAKTAFRLFLVVLIALFFAIMGGKEVAAQEPTDSVDTGVVVLNVPGELSSLVGGQTCIIHNEQRVSREKKLKFRVEWNDCEGQISYDTVVGNQVVSGSFEITGSGEKLAINRVFNDLQEGDLVRTTVSFNGISLPGLTVESVYVGNKWPVWVKMRQISDCVVLFEGHTDPYIVVDMSGQFLDKQYRGTVDWVVGPYDFSDAGPEVEFLVRAWKDKYYGDDIRANVKFGPIPNPCHNPVTPTPTVTLTPTPTETPLTPTLPAPSPMPTETPVPVACVEFKADKVESTEFPFVTDYQIKHIGATDFKVEGDDVEILEGGNEGQLLVKGGDASARAYVSADGGQTWVTTTDATDACFVQFEKKDIPTFSQDEWVDVNPDAQRKRIGEKFTDHNSPQYKAAIADLERKLAESAGVIGDSGLTFDPIHWDVNPDGVIDYQFTVDTSRSDATYGEIVQVTGNYVYIDEPVAVEDFNGVNRRDGVANLFIVARGHMQRELRWFGPTGMPRPMLEEHYLSWAQPVPGVNSTYYQVKKNPYSDISPDDIRAMYNSSESMGRVLWHEGYFATNKTLKVMEGALGAGTYSVYMLEFPENAIKSFVHPENVSYPVVPMFSFFPTGMYYGKPLQMEIHNSGYKFFWVDAQGNQGWVEFAFDHYNNQGWMFQPDPITGEYKYILSSEETARLRRAAAAISFVRSGNQVVIDPVKYGEFLYTKVQLMLVHANEYPILKLNIVGLPDKWARELGYKGYGENMFAKAYTARGLANSTIAKLLAAAPADRDANAISHVNNVMVPEVNELLTLIGAKPIKNFDEALAAFEALEKARAEAALSWVDPGMYWDVAVPGNPPFGDTVYGFNWVRFLADGGDPMDLFNVYEIAIHEIQAGDSYTSIAGQWGTHAGTLIRLNAGKELVAGEYLIIGSGYNNFPTVSLEGVPAGFEYLIDPLYGAKQGTTGGGISPVVFFAIVVSLLVLAGGGVLVWRRRQAK
jgi:hypothetical protein